jgi:hypothetical protein
MLIASCRLCCAVVVCVLAGIAFAQTPPAEQIVANQDRVPAGRLENGILTLHLELRSGAWHP